MSGPAPSSENPSRRALRLAVGVTLTFVVAQLIGWPLAHPAPVFTALLLQAAEPLSVRDGFATLGSILFYIVSGYLVPATLPGSHGSGRLPLAVPVLCDSANVTRQ